MTICDLGLPMTVARLLPTINARRKRTSDAIRPGVLPAAARGDDRARRRDMRLRVPFSPAGRSGPHYAVRQPPEPRVAGAHIPVCDAGDRQLRTGANFRDGRDSTRQPAQCPVSFTIQIVGVRAWGLVFGVTGAIIVDMAAAASCSQPMLCATASGMEASSILNCARAGGFLLRAGVGLIAAIVWSRTELAFLAISEAREAGLYAVANTLAQVATQAPLLMTERTVGAFRQAPCDRRSRFRLKRAFRSAVRFVASLWVPACFGVAALAPSLVRRCLDGILREASGPAAVLVAAQAFGAVSAVSSALLFAAERNYVLVGPARWGVAVLVSGFTIIPQYGLDEAVYARSPFQFAIVAAGFIYIGQRLDCPTPYLLRSMRIILAAAGCGFTGARDRHHVSRLARHSARRVHGGARLSCTCDCFAPCRKKGCRTGARRRRQMPSWISPCAPRRSSSSSNADQPASWKRSRVRWCSAKDLEGRVVVRRPGAAEFRWLVDAHAVRTMPLQRTRLHHEVGGVADGAASSRSPQARDVSMACIQFRRANGAIFRDRSRPDR